MLQKTIGRGLPDAYGRRRKVAALAIDSGYRSQVVYATVRVNRQLTGLEVIYETKGVDGW